MLLEIVSPDAIIFTGNVSLVQLPGVDGSFEILNNHAAIISVLKLGKVKVIDENDKTQYFDIKGGVLEVLNNKALILAE
ncbi:MAG: ATP synthase F1 subunit epsilon [Bacteroidetes bacterium CG2_30_32_10]|nr:MAG: ATP synthase F1 subunit epsilon [Bacteroidetes bacterium CG2_30_32_10]